MISGPPVTEYYREYVARLTAILGSDKLHSVVSSFAPRLSAATAAAAAAGNAAATAAATAAAAAANVGGSSAAGMVGQKRPLSSGSAPGTPLAPIQARVRYVAAVRACVFTDLNTHNSHSSNHPHRSRSPSCRS